MNANSIKSAIDARIEALNNEIANSTKTGPIREISNNRCELHIDALDRFVHQINDEMTSDEILAQMQAEVDRFDEKSMNSTGEYSNRYGAYATALERMVRDLTK